MFLCVIQVQFFLNSFPHNPEILQPDKRKLLKTLWGKEKMLVTSIFSFSRNVFYSFHNKILSFGKDLTCYLIVPNSSPNDKILDSVTWKAFADDQIIVSQMMISLCGRVKKYCGKRRKCWLPEYSCPFSTFFFQKLSLSR